MFQRRESEDSRQPVTEFREPNYFSRIVFALGFFSGRSCRTWSSRVIACLVLSPSSYVPIRCSGQWSSPAATNAFRDFGESRCCLKAYRSSSSLKQDWLFYRAVISLFRRFRSWPGFVEAFDRRVVNAYQRNVDGQDRRSGSLAHCCVTPGDRSMANMQRAGRRSHI